MIASIAACQISNRVFALPSSNSKIEREARDDVHDLVGVRRLRMTHDDRRRGSAATPAITQSSVLRLEPLPEGDHDDERERRPRRRSTRRA